MDYKSVFLETLEIEAQAILSAKERFSSEQIQGLADIFNILVKTGGNFIFCGVGKSGFIGQKLASTFCSLGLPSFFLHPTEALHGDLGRVRKEDAIVFISKSGTTEEIMKMLPFLVIEKNLRIGLLGNLDSPLKTHVEISFDCSVVKEACLNNQAPTTSSTLALAVGDAMAVLFEKVTGLSKEGFAINHPGGILGKSLRLHVKDLMIPFSQCPIISSEKTLRDAILKMTEIPLGICIVADAQFRLQGILVEGDIRRIFTESAKNNQLQGQGEILGQKIEKLMNPRPIVTDPDVLAFTALELMEKRKNQISVLPVVKDQTFVGIIRLHDLLKEGFSVKS
jgi:arabinose-5-phosphate isomerase